MHYPNEDGALSSLQQIIPLLHKHDFRWVITGGFACYVYGVDRSITDIDIDIDTSKDDFLFLAFLKELEPSVSQPLMHFIDQNYDNYNVEIKLGQQIVDICPMKELKIFDKSKGLHVSFYAKGFPEIELISFRGIELPLLSKELIIKNKEMLQREVDHQDIAGLKKLLKTKE